MNNIMDINNISIIDEAGNYLNIIDVDDVLLNQNDLELQNLLKSWGMSKDSIEHLRKNEITLGVLKVMSIQEYLELFEGRTMGQRILFKNGWMTWRNNLVSNAYMYIIIIKHTEMCS